MSKPASLPSVDRAARAGRVPASRPDGQAGWRRVALASLPLMMMSAGILALGDPVARLEWVLALMAVGFGALLWAERRLRGLAATRATVLAILVAAALMRLSLLALPATLSDDTLRYQWDGKVVAAGLDPYRLAPDAPELAALRDGPWQRMPHREVATVYPPLALGLFALAAQSGAPLLVLKLVFTAADLLLCWLLLALARRLAVPPSRVVLYAWNPLVLVEVAGMGHVDALAVCAAAATVYLLIRARPGAAGLAAALGVLAKLGPAVALPLWTRLSARPWRFLGVATALTAAVLLPIALGGIPSGLVTYGVSWEFNGPIYEPLWRLVESTELDQGLARWLDRRKEATGDHEFWNLFYPYVYPRLLAKLILAVGMLTVVAASWRARRGEPRVAVTATGALFGALLLLSATVYPWYLLWVLPWAALARHRAWLALSALLPLSYLPQHRPLEPFGWIFAAIWIPFFLMLLHEPRWSID